MGTHPSCWARFYTGYPNKILLDQERSFIIEQFRAAAQFQVI